MFGTCLCAPLRHPLPFPFTGTFLYLCVCIPLDAPKHTSTNAQCRAARKDVKYSNQPTTTREMGDTVPRDVSPSLPPSKPSARTRKYARTHIMFHCMAWPVTIITLLCRYWHTLWFFFFLFSFFLFLSRPVHYWKHQVIGHFRRLLTYSCGLSAPSQLTTPSLLFFFFFFSSTPLTPHEASLSCLASLSALECSENICRTDQLWLCCHRSP